MGYTWKNTWKEILMVTTDLEDRIREAIAAEVRAFNPDPTARVMAVIRESEVLVA